MNKKYSYLIKIEYLGFRYHGWQVQPQVKTVQKMVERTLAFVLQHSNFKILGASRTDMMVSAHAAAFELFLEEELEVKPFLGQFNKSLPNDIRALTIEKAGPNFNIIQDSKRKEYRYLFSSGEKTHPFCAPFLLGVQENLEVPLMQKGAKLFEGCHNFQRYAYKPSEKTVFEREIFLAEITENTELTASFFPETTYVFKVQGNGFLRYQIRLMMGVLLQLGKGEVDLHFIEDTLKNPGPETLKELAPASGLSLQSMDFEKQ
jgi:tRNA pseudouridine38-40 synthase